ncbi:TspO/MBR family protein [Terrihabitans rhizophilus]|uniref:TspO/MBR family protein n=1 Tax=Terrihabitans rhizophilus TaxID=3092662 RepID=A0ABU4RSX6_9HYPH|nr:TspO/MBR family protein [Terrihabitans sp. PJ23]MDX6806785.1 TspO/MBR family protein [Terrihabitans sp. PJ23]
MDTSRSFNIARLRSPLALLLSVLICAAALRLGSLFTTPHIGPWYSGLAKPFFTPPNWAFPVVWPVLFLLMAVALWRILTRSAVPLTRNYALLPFAVQLALNVLWSYAFFASRSPAAGMIVIVALLAAIIWTIAAFRRYDSLAAWLLAPYLLWVAYACALNAGIWRLNP